MSELTINDARLTPIAGKVLAGKRLDFDDGIALYRSPDLLAVGWLAWLVPGYLVPWIAVLGHSRFPVVRYANGT